MISFQSFRQFSLSLSWCISFPRITSWNRARKKRFTRIEIFRAKCFRLFNPGATCSRLLFNTWKRGKLQLNSILFYEHVPVLWSVQFAYPRFNVSQGREEAGDIKILRNRSPRLSRGDELEIYLCKRIRSIIETTMTDQNSTAFYFSPPPSFLPSSLSRVSIDQSAL